MTRTGYCVAEFSNVPEEIERLRAQAQVVAVLEDTAFVAAGLPEHGLGLDVGCGPGFIAERLVRLRPKLCLVGMDLDPQTLGEARKSRRIESVVRADVHHLPFGASTFDLVFGRLILRHIPRPEAALDEAVRVLRRGGELIIEDCDDASILLEPEPPGFAEVLRARQQAVRRRGANPDLARRLFAMLGERPLARVDVQAIPVTSCAIGAEAFARIVLQPATEAIDKDLLSGTMIEECRSAIARWGSSSTSFGMTTLLVCRGTRV